MPSFYDDDDADCDGENDDDDDVDVDGYDDNDDKASLFLGRVKYILF